MPTKLGRPYSTDWRGDPPHMLKEDVPVWYRYLDTVKDSFINLYYDCLLGGPTLSAAQEEDPMLRMWRSNNSKRADAIAETATHVLIIEVAKNPGLRAVGQVQVYRSLWIEDPKIDKPEKVILVFESLDTDLLAAAAQFGILLYRMPPVPL